MTLTLYHHPLASFCHKVLIGLYDNDTPFTGEIVNLQDAEASNQFFALWPVGKIPVLRDESRQATIPETTVIIEYLQQHYPGPSRLLPADADLCLDARLWDRFFDNYVQVPMQKIVLDRLRPTDQKDPAGVADARAMLTTAYGMIERRMANRLWAVGDSFGIADCAAAPALFYAGIVQPFAEAHPHASAYFERLVERPSFARVLDEARPYLGMFPFRDETPSRFL